MKFVKSAFLSVVFACFGFLCVIDGAISSCVNYNDSNRTCGGARPPACAGSFCHNGVAYECRSGCYCTGGMSTPTTQNVENKCASHEDPSLEQFGVYLCPNSHPKSLSGRSLITSCYSSGTCGAGTDAVKANSENNGAHVYYGAINGCEPGKYIRFLSSGCANCPAGKYCAGLSGTKYTSCNNQGINGDCSEGNLYSLSGAAECSSCEEVGKAVVEQNGLNVNCQTCGAGKYANATHTNCDTCPVGYECPPRDENRPDDRPGGIAIRCGFDGDNENNQYQDEEGKTSCKTCTGTGKGVVVTTNDDDVRLHTGCTTCPDGTYPYNGICKTCEAGYYCKNGIRTICAKGSYAGTGQSSCAECARYYTTESTGSTSRNDCFLVRIKLKLNQEDTGISFPTCLLQGDINMTVVRRTSS